MRVVIGVDWSDQAFAAVTQTFQLYRPTDVTLVHGIDLGILEHPVVAQAGDLHGYDDFRNAMIDSGRQLLDRAADMIPSEIEPIRKVNEIGSPGSARSRQCRKPFRRPGRRRRAWTKLSVRGRAWKCLPSGPHAWLLSDPDCQGNCPQSSASTRRHRGSGRRRPNRELADTPSLCVPTESACFMLSFQSGSATPTMRWEPEHGGKEQSAMRKNSSNRPPANS